ncbi:MAG: EF-P beta-lysylation protein EpmB [Thiotrichaceae bacterium]|nr:EF-P beta-lysylation protein EpmB [Thiotrichaceae bacterium]
MPLKNPVKPWQKSLANAIRSVDELIDQLNLDPQHPDARYYDASTFPLRVPASFVAKMQPQNWLDPLLLQVLPQTIENKLTHHFTLDPVGDMEAAKQNGILQKYQGRALILASAACPIHCRYCFRQHFPYSEHVRYQDDWQSIIRVLEQDTSIHEVILSGGDPLSLNDLSLASLCQQMSKIKHIDTLRIHSRYPIVLPERINDEFLAWFQALTLNKIIVIHCNHANEIDSTTATALKKIRLAGGMLYNQSVLLQGINDSVETLSALSNQLINHHVTPYYLHQLDKVQGAAHFEVSDERAIELIDSLRNRLPGYRVPKLVREVATQLSKTPLY